MAARRGHQAPSSRPPPGRSRGPPRGPSGQRGGTINTGAPPRPVGNRPTTHSAPGNLRTARERTDMAIVTMRQLLESGVHFGHQTRRWNPKMKRFILTERNGIYVIDLQQTVEGINTAYDFVKEIVARGGSILFVGTKKQAQAAVAEQAQRVGMPYVNQRWLGGMLTGDMGISYVSGRDVFKTFTSKLPATLLLTALSILITVIVSIPLGVLAAVHHDKATDYMLRFLSFIGNSMPNFFVALLLMQMLAIKLRWLPVIASGTSVKSAVMPTLTLAIAMSAKYMRQVRATVLEELNKEYVTGAKARGIRGRVILWRSVLKSSMLTIITLLALSIGSLLGGTAIIESIFMWDGVGKLAVDAITMRDYPLIQAYVVWMAIIYVMVNLITDLLYHALDPRIRLGVSKG